MLDIYWYILLSLKALWDNFVKYYIKDGWKHGRISWCKNTSMSFKLNKMVPYFSIYILTTFSTNLLKMYSMKHAFCTLSHRCNLPTWLISFSITSPDFYILAIFSFIKGDAILASITFIYTKLLRTRERWKAEDRKG